MSDQFTPLVIDRETLIDVARDAYADEVRNKREKEINAFKQALIAAFQTDFNVEGDYLELDGPEGEHTTTYRLRIGEGLARTNAMVLFRHNNAMNIADTAATDSQGFRIQVHDLVSLGYAIAALENNRKGSR